MSLTFEQMPSAIERIIESLKRIEHRLNQQINMDDSETENGESLFTVPEAAEFLHLSVPTIYGLTHKRQVPHQKRGKRIYFLKSDLLDWVKKGKRMTNEEIEQQAENYLIRRNRRK